MIRFNLPVQGTGFTEKTEMLSSQIHEFLESDVLSEALSVMGVDRTTVFDKFNNRSGLDGKVIESQYLEKVKIRPETSQRMYFLFRELGFIDINKPVIHHPSRIVILGASYRATWDRTCAAARWKDEHTKSVDGLGCYRPISPIERSAVKEPYSSAETEFGVLSDAILSCFQLDGSEVIDDFHGDRNLNRIHCVRAIDNRESECKYRVFSAPSTEPDVRRADTADTIQYYLDRTEPDDSMLFITNNRYCNRQFLQIVYEMLRRNQLFPMDIIGCFDDENLVSEDDNRYDVMQYMLDIVAMLDWSKRVLDLLAEKNT